jgi:hypothetical protein
MDRARSKAMNELEVIVVDDFTCDKTGELSAQLCPQLTIRLLLHDQNLGKAPHYARRSVPISKCYERTYQEGKKIGWKDDFHAV